MGAEEALRDAAVGLAGGVLVSNADGSEWTSRSVETSAGLFSIAWKGQRGIAAGDRGVLFVTSDGGATWTEPKRPKLFNWIAGAAFVGESMFSAQSGGSKVALAFLVHRLRAGGFRLFDTQFLTPHLASLGAVEIPRAEYHRRLAEAIALPARFEPEGYCPSASSVLSGVSSASGGA